MNVLRVQAFMPISKKAMPKASKAVKKLNDVALTPWEFEKMLNEPKANVVKKHATGGGSVCSESFSIEAPDLYSC